jgi:predicted nucleic acid-binding protein
MSRRPRALVLDSWAILAYFEDEPAGKTVATLIADARENGIPMLMSVVNAGEVWYIITREVSGSEADEAVASLHKMGIEFIEINWPLARQAGEFKAKFRMSYADCFAAALAVNRKAELVTGDKEFRQLGDTIKVQWL